MWYVYIIECENDKLYTGVTNDLERRFTEHVGAHGAKFTRANRAKKMLYSEEFGIRSNACKREAQIKGWRRIKKLNLIKYGHPSGEQRGARDER